MSRAKILPIEFSSYESDDDCLTFYNVTFVEPWFHYKAGEKSTMLSFYQITGEVMVHQIGTPMQVVSVLLMVDGFNPE